MAFKQETTGSKQYLLQSEIKTAVKRTVYHIIDNTYFRAVFLNRFFFLFYRVKETKKQFTSA